ncbi:MAG: biotin synthase BioB, partial [Fibrobacter sp.]|nr:biotin synthase BioB [Fibrobacter sp.]
HTWDERVETIRRAKKVGLHVCCGGILGLGESWEQRKEFCLQIRELDIDTVPLNFLNPIKGTRVAPTQDTPLDLLKVVSLFRLAMPKRTIKVCGGRELHLGQLQGLLFFAGANGYVSGGYLTTKGAGVDTDDLLIRSLGLTPRLRTVSE